jgi:hypothetical protein
VRGGVKLANKHGVKLRQSFERTSGRGTESKSWKKSSAPARRWLKIMFSYIPNTTLVLAPGDVMEGLALPALMGSRAAVCYESKRVRLEPRDCQESARFCRRIFLQARIL